MNFYIGLDIGGTNIKAGTILENGTIFNNNINMYPSLSKENKNTILKNIINIIEKEFNLYTLNGNLLGIGIAFPGPFDYKNGICKIKGINKYDSLYNVSIKIELLKYINNSFLKNNTIDNFSILFENDATLFALGELEQNDFLKNNKTIAICIGTGAGSTYLENGKVLKSGKGIAQNGWIYKLPFKKSIIDDYISARGIINFYNSLSNNKVNNVKDIALKYNIDENSNITFNHFGEDLANVLNMILKDFNAKNIILGGQITKSYSLFKDSLLYNMNFNPNILLSKDTSKSTLIGAMALFK